MEIIYFLIFIFLIFLLSLGYLVISSFAIENAKLKYAQKNSIQEDLELATSDQLIGELKKRDQLPIIIVKTNNEGIFVDCLNIPPALSVQVLEAAANLVRDKIKRKMQDFDDVE